MEFEQLQDRAVRRSTIEEEILAIPVASQKQPDFSGSGHEQYDLLAEHFANRYVAIGERLKALPADHEQAFDPSEGSFLRRSSQFRIKSGLETGPKELLADVSATYIEGACTDVSVSWWAPSRLSEGMKFGREDLSVEDLSSWNNEHLHGQLSALEASVGIIESSLAVDTAR